MKSRDLKLFGETFTHVCDKTGRQTTYCVYDMIAHCKATAVPVSSPLESSDELANGSHVEQCNVPVEAYHAKYCMENRGVEEHRLARLYEGGPAVIEAQPIIFIKQEDGSMLLVDGTHRYITAFMLKMANVPAYFVPWLVAVPFIVEDAPDVDPDALMNSFSGLL